MEFQIGQIFEGEYPPEAAVWCNENKAYIEKRGEGYIILQNEPPSPETLFARLRAERDRRIAATDYLIMPDYPLPEDSRTVVQAYRQALRDLPVLEGAPWDGGGEATPWPAMPAVQRLQLPPEMLE